MAAPIRSASAIRPNLSKWLDFVRGGAAIAVLLAHVQAVMFLPWPANAPHGALGLAAHLLNAVSRGGRAAVIVFFVLSGYLVGGGYLSRYLGDRDDPIDYVAARAARMWMVIVPALLLTYALDGASLFLHHGQQLIDARDDFFHGRSDLWRTLTPGTFACNALFAQTIWCRQFGTNLSLWSLSNEGLYYVIWFGLVTGLRRRWALLPALAAGCMMALADPALGSAPGGYFGYLAVWIAGALAFCFDCRTRIPLILLGCAACGLIVHHRTDLATDMMIGGCFVAVVKLFEIHDTPFPTGGALSHAAAELSFSLYAIHLPIVLFILASSGIVGLLPYSGVAIGLYLAICILCVAAAVLFWWLFERRTKRLKAVLRTLLARAVARPAAG